MMQPIHSKSALLVMDMQNSIVSRFAQQEEALLPFQKAIAAARKSNVPVIYVKLAFRAGYPEVSPRNKIFAGIASRAGFGSQDASMDIHEAVQPRPEEAIVTKLRVSAFAGSDLEVLLRAQQIETLVLTGIATSGVVLSTLREAADKDYALQVLSDACLDADPEVHRVLMEKVFPRQADVHTVEEWIATLEA